MNLIDIGANLTHDSFDHDRDAVLQRARDAGVVQMMVTGASREHWPNAVALAQGRPGFRYARSLDVLTMSREEGLVTKSNLILGMGETREEVS